MRPGQQQNKQRMRGRGRKGPNPMSRSYESNGPDVKIRGTAQHVAEKYIALARDANASGDRVMAENYLQHAEHYGRIVAAAQGIFQLQREEPDVLDGEYEDGDEEGFVEGAGTTNGHPYPVPERAQGEQQRQPMQARENRDYQNRDGQNNRDNQGNRDNQNNREGREQRFDRNRNRDRDFNRDNQNRDGQNRDNRDGQNRERNRDFNRQNNEERRSYEGRERQNWRDSQVPNGLGPQPNVGEAASEDVRPVSAQNQPENVAESRSTDRRYDEALSVAAVTEQESGFGQAPATQDAVAAPEGSIYTEETAGEMREQRRRGRPRRPRFGESDTGSEASAAPEESVSAPAPAPVEAPVAESVAAEPAQAATDAPAAKRRPGRPRKKKVEDEGGEGDNSHLPDFLLASNG